MIAPTLLKAILKFCTTNKLSLLCFVFFCSQIIQDRVLVRLPLCCRKKITQYILNGKIKNFLCWKILMQQTYFVLIVITSFSSSCLDQKTNKLPSAHLAAKETKNNGVIKKRAKWHYMFFSKIKTQFCSFLFCLVFNLQICQIILPDPV